MRAGTPGTVLTDALMPFAVRAALVDLLLAVFSDLAQRPASLVWFSELDLFRAELIAEVESGCGTGQDHQPQRQETIVAGPLLETDGL